ncbi:hypothetical protein OJF2_60140 [Aquisphaera giovannonii]|uniref:Uncharacterized protein n=2 Tax=Aquisphaera giovannonii TaxID=406548 RepID=A0A5B9WA42_9BACT|nr:hypothetical protein OJF2_60140 [Aquisphaera giovannonii]
MRIRVADLATLVASAAVSMAVLRLHPWIGIVIAVTLTLGWARCIAIGARIEGLRGTPWGRRLIYFDSLVVAFTIVLLGLVTAVVSVVVANVVAGLIRDQPRLDPGRLAEAIVLGLVAVTTARLSGRYIHRSWSPVESRPREIQARPSAGGPNLPRPSK